jgi:hypothetical protein
MRSSREQVMDVIKRWQSENCSIRFDFISVDHSLEINCPIYLYASTNPLDDSSFSLVDATRRSRVNVKLKAADTYDITDIKREAHSTFKDKVDYCFSVTVPYGELGDLYLYELETAGSKKVM